MDKKAIVLIGGGGHCKSCIDVIESTNKFRIIGILDVKEKIGESILGYKIIGADDEIEQCIRKGYSFHISVGQIGNGQVREDLFHRVVELGGELPILISNQSYVSRHALLENGVIIMHGAVINAASIINENTIINSQVLIEHDAVVGKHCHIATKAVINGGVKVGNNSFIGSGAITKQYINIPDNSFIKANSLVR